MTSGNTIKTKRTAAGISGDVVCKKVGKSRSWLCGVERGYITPAPEELARLDAGLDELINAKSVLRQTAAALGWPCVA
jgi:transcriptional regulator with XRE-family HTH domain